jgi:acyl carrier protein
MAVEVDEAVRGRFRRMGFPLIDAEHGLELLHRSLGLDLAYALAAPLDRSALRSLEEAGSLSPLFRGLLPASRRRKRGDDAFVRQLGQLPEDEREAALLAFVRERAASILGHDAVDAVDAEASFKDLGFDSLGAVELRNQLVLETGISLDPTLVFDYPNPRAVAGYLLGELQGKVAGESSPLLEEFDRLEAALGAVDAGERPRAAARLRSLNARYRELLAVGADGSEAGDEQAKADVGAASDDELFELIDKELGE